MKSGTAIVVCLSGAAALIPFESAGAQDVPSGGGQRLEEVVVSAQKRAQNLQDVPIAVTALSGTQVESQRLFSLAEIAHAVPNFTVAQQSPSQPTLTIRGVGSTDREAGSDRSVVPFVDEVYIGRTSASTFDIFDVERVEVLRGPQGTLFGRNVSGGAVSISTVKPQDVFDAKFQLTGSNYNRQEARGAINMPLSDQWAVRLTGSATRSDGFYRNIVLGRDDVQSPRNLDGRLQVRWDNKTDKSLLLSVTGTREDVDGIASKNAPGQNSAADFAAALTTYNTRAFPPYLAGGAFDVENNILGFSQGRGVRTFARYEQNLGFATLTIIPAYLHNRLHEMRDLGGVPIRPAGALTAGFNSTRDERETYDASSLEARLSASTDDDRVNWVAGAFYLNEDTDRTQGLIRQVNNAYSSVAFVQRARNDSVAGFGQIGWKFVPGFELTAGARYTRDRKKFGLAVVDLLTPAERAALRAQLGRAPGINPATELFSGTAENSYGSVTPRVALAWEPARNQNLYASWAKGFKSGGFDGNASRLAALANGFAPETVNTYEVGIKSLLLDQSLRLNFAAFYSDFKNLQLRDRRLLIPDDPTTNVVTVINAARATIKGLELESNWKLTSEFAFGAMVSLLHSTVDEVAPGSTLIQGTKLPRAPEYEVGVNTVYRLAADRSGLPADIEFAAEYQRTGLSYFDINEQLGGKQPAFDLVNARVTLFNPRKNWSLMFWGRNLTDTRYFADAQSTQAGRLGAVVFGDPRTYGATLSWSLR
jgi:iron complex outermembrane receptor protein